MELNPVMGVKDHTQYWHKVTFQVALVFSAGNPKSSYGGQVQNSFWRPENDEGKKANFTQVQQPEIHTCGTTYEPNKSLFHLSVYSKAEFDLSFLWIDYFVHFYRKGIYR